MENKELARQEQTQPATSDQQNLALALETARINQAPLEDVKQVLRYAMMKIGLRSQNWPTDIEKGLLIQHIVKDFGGHAVDEIKLAFDMAIAGKLDVEVNCYENFSCLYFSSIMNAYRKWAAEEKRHLETKELPAAAPPPNLSDQTMQEWMEYTQQQMKNGKGLSVDFMPIPLYEWGEKKGLFNKTGPEKREYLQRAVSFRHGKLIELAIEENSAGNRKVLADFNDMKEAGEFKGPEVQILKNLAKKMILFDYFKSKP